MLFSKVRACRSVRGFALSLTVLAYAAVAGGCATTYHISVVNEDPARPDYAEDEMSSHLWGANNSPRTLEVDCEEQGVGLNDIEVVDSFGADVLSVITLGLWKRIKVRHRCHAG